jgi:hypothetical protein
MSTRANRMHEACNTGGTHFTPAEHKRIDAYLARHAPVSLSPKPGTAGNRRKPWPTEPEVRRMSAVAKVVLRARYKKYGVPLPTYLVPMTKAQAAHIGNAVIRQKKAEAAA